MIRTITTQTLRRFCLQPTIVCNRQLCRAKLPMVTCSLSNLNFVRSRHVTSGIQGRRNTKLRSKDNDSDNEYSKCVEDAKDEKNDELVNLLDSEYQSIANEILPNGQIIRSEQNVLVIQPYIRLFGPKRTATRPDIKLLEAEDLIRSLDNWTIQESVKVGLPTFDRNTFFGTGKLAELVKLSRKYNGNTYKEVSCIFISKSVLSRRQRATLERVFKLPVLDRFSVVIQILRLHATSRESKLQIALAEMPYIWRQIGISNEMHRSKLNDAQRMVLRNREKNIKAELTKIRANRTATRKRRADKQFPVIAVVGYTNAGKTSLIKALTNELTMQPRNQLFATLDVTAHGGVLPCNLQVLYMDTIGFMSDIPTGLFECFVATLEDAMFADLIIHVQDVSHPNIVEQRKFVEHTLKELTFAPNEDNSHLLQNIIHVGNKCDLVGNLDEIAEMYDESNDANVTGEKMHFVSSTQKFGMKRLVEAIERNILHVTNRKKMIIRVPQGGQELPWLYKNATVTHTESDSKSCDYVLAHVLVTDLMVIQFKNTFLSRK